MIKEVKSMKYRREIALKNGETLLLRSLCAQDAEETLRVLKKTAGETGFMMRYENEWNVTTQQEREALAQTASAPKSLMLGAFVDGRLVGAANFRPVHPGDRARHRAGMGLSVLKAHWGKGIGTALIQALIDAARTTALEQLELSVMSQNTRAKALYTRLGFAEYGRLPRAIKHRDGTYDELILMLLDLRRRA